MRFIGNKTALLDNINDFICGNIPYYEDMIFCDIFSGTSSVARYFKKDFQIISNDLLYFSYVLQKATIDNNRFPNFKNLKKELNLNNYDDLLNYLENSPLDKLQKDYNINDEELFIYNNYTPSSDVCERMYFKPETGKRIDLIRILLNKWLENKTISENEYFYLLAILIETVPYYSNICGVYGAYLKTWDKRTYNPFKLQNLEIINNNKDNISYNCDAHELIKKIKGDILYLDPPYNTRQYPPNYHVLETIAKYDYPEIKGVSGMREYKEQISMFCRKKEVYNALNDIIKNANFQYIIMSYSTDGILTIDEIEEIFRNHGISDTYKMAKPIEYRQFKSQKRPSKKDLHELLFFVEKEVENPRINDKKLFRKKKEIQTTLK
ncbi:DNA adenine methylase [Methanobrevibacter sp.]|uniref:DNA adenine methylase n=1 Tax=Methanobrevibacter sp. TaxID=66852 RepID=UPI00386A54EA